MIRSARFGPITGPARLDELAGRDHRRVTEDGDQVRLAAGFDAQHAEPVLFVVKRDAVDQPGQDIGPRVHLHALKLSRSAEVGDKAQLFTSPKPRSNRMSGRPTGNNQPV